MNTLEQFLFILLPAVVIAGSIGAALLRRTAVRGHRRHGPGLPAAPDPAGEGGPILTTQAFAGSDAPRPIDIPFERLTGERHVRRDQDIRGRRTA